MRAGKTWIYVYYVDVACTPKLKRFARRKAADRWIEAFLKKHAGNPDCCFQFMIEGKMLESVPYYGGNAVEALSACHGQDCSP